jgi:Kef-type K+ transport system membrane component KefB
MPQISFVNLLIVAAVAVAVLAPLLLGYLPRLRLPAVLVDIVALGAFLAGALVNLVDRDSASHPHFRIKLDAIGYGFLVPVFFVASGVRLDLQGLLAQPSALLRVPVFLPALLVIRGLPALFYLRDLGWPTTVAAALLQATSLPFLVTAATIGMQVGPISSVTGAALICAGLLSVVISRRMRCRGCESLRVHAHQARRLRRATLRPARRRCKCRGRPPLQPVVSDS